MARLDPAEAAGIPIPTIGEVVEAYSEVLAHNNEHSFATVLGRAIAGFSAGATIQEAIDTESQNSITRGETNTEVIGMVHGNSFTMIGINVAPIGERHINGSTGAPVSSAELRPVLVGPELFAGFLSTVHAEDIEPGSRQFLGDVLRTLNQVTRTAFDPYPRKPVSEELQPQLTEVGEDALRAFDRIEDDYARLGLDGESMRRRMRNISPELNTFLREGSDDGRIPTELVDEYHAYQDDLLWRNTFEQLHDRATYWGRGLIREYMLAEFHEYLRPPEEQEWGPSQWPLGGPAGRWNQAVSFVTDLDGEERTQEFGQEVRANLVVSLDAALAEIAGIPDEDWYEGRQPDVQNLQNLRNFFARDEYDAEALATYTEYR